MLQSASPTASAERWIARTATSVPAAASAPSSSPVDPVHPWARAQATVAVPDAMPSSVHGAPAASGSRRRSCIWPRCPALPEAPAMSRDPRMIPPPMPVETTMPMPFSVPRRAPCQCSARAMQVPSRRSSTAPVVNRRTASTTRKAASRGRLIGEMEPSVVPIGPAEPMPIPDTDPPCAATLCPAVAMIVASRSARVASGPVAPRNRVPGTIRPSVSTTAASTFVPPMSIARASCITAPSRSGARRLRSGTSVLGTTRL